MPDDQDNPVTGSIDLGLRLPGNDVSVYFAADGERVDFITNQGDWTAYERDMALAALTAYAAVADLRITVTDDPGTASFRLTRSEAAIGSLGFMNPPDPAYGSAQGIAWFNSLPYWSDAEGGLLDPGSYMFTIFLHEFGHGFGLGHPFDDGGDAVVMPPVGPGLGLDQGIFTVMSYNDGWPEAPEGLPDSRAWGWNLGPSAIDIAVIQAHYGANMATATGATRYVLPRENAGGTGFLAIWDAGGQDSIVHRGPLAAVIDLRAATLVAEPGGGGFVSHATGIHGGFTIAHGVVIEGAQGGGGDDRIIGNAAANRMAGRGGADLLQGGNGRDVIDGGAGRDTLAGDRGDDRLTGGGGADVFVIARAAGRDTITDFGPLDRLDLAAFGFGSAAEALARVDAAEDGLHLRIGRTDLLILTAGIDSLTEAMLLI